MGHPDHSSSHRSELFPSFGAPIAVPQRGRWHWEPFPDTRAASGRPTGLALNVAPDPAADTLVIYFQAGGACWDYLTSSLQFAGYGAVMHLGGFTQKTWERSPTAKVHRRMWLFDRDDATNPFAGSHHVYVPYCTGDIYAGNRVASFQGPLPFMKRVLHFSGQSNVLAYLRRLMPTFPNLRRIYLVGSSAGGYGAAFAWWLVNECWQTVPVDVISDAGHPLLVPRKKFDRWLSTWGPRLPEDGPEIREGLLQLLEYMERRYLGRDRYALITCRRDLIMSAFMGQYPWTHADEIDRLKETFFDDSGRYPGTIHARYFIMDGYGHTVFPFNMVDRARIGEMSVKRWLRQMVDEDPAWESWYQKGKHIETSDHRTVPERVPLGAPG